MKYILPSLPFQWEDVSHLAYPSVRNLMRILAITRPRVENELSIQDRHHTCKFGT